jgi:hypothetical protein
VEQGHHKACLAELASACGFKLSNSLGIETDADHEQSWLSVDLACWNGTDSATHQCSRNAIRRTGQANLASEDICGTQRNDAQSYLSTQEAAADIMHSAIASSRHDRVKSCRKSGIGSRTHAFAMSARMYAL